MYQIKKSPEDFVVEEITPNEDVLEIKKDYKFNPETKGNNLICVLIKDNWEQNKAIRAISNSLHMSRRRIGFAGTKDKRAVTSQRVSINNAEPKDLENFKVNRLKLFPLEKTRERVTLGDLWGNRFTLKIETDQEIKEVPEKIPNYYGHQRFGKVRPITHLVGEALLKKNPEEAVKIYLTKEFPEENPESLKARRWLKENWGEFKEALKKYPTYLHYERILLHHLSEYPLDHINAIRKLPHNLEMMFIHAYQSHLFNEYIDEIKDKNLKQEEGPIYGYNTEIKNEYELRILERHDLDLSEFKNTLMPELSEKGERRKLFIELKDFEVLKEGEGFYIVRFSLPKGSYATVAVEQLFGGKKDE